MFIQKMTEAECLSILTRTRLGRLACAHENQPYIVPIYFAYEQPYLYAFTTPGQKVEWMRYNPLVCLEVDEVEDSEHWTSVVIFGRYEELPGYACMEGPMAPRPRAAEQERRAGGKQVARPVASGTRGSR